MAGDVSGQGLLLQGGRLVGAAETVDADLLVERGRIAAVGRGLRAPGARVVNCAGLLVMPGFIDAHTHLDGPQDTPGGRIRTADDWDSGTAAALAGGTTTVVDFSVQETGGTLAEAVEAWHALAASRTRIDYGLHVVLTDLREDVRAEVARLPGLGVVSLKVFMAYRRSPLYLDDARLLDALRAAAAAGLPVTVHAENGEVIDALVADALARGDRSPEHHAATRPPEVEADATARVIRLAALAGARIVVVHVSCAAALEEVRRARRRGRPVHAETCPQYLAFTAQDLARPGFEGAKYVCSPPLRGREDQEALWDALRDGDLELFSSDHCAFDFADQKSLGHHDFSRIPNGIAGIEERAAVLWTLGVGAGRLSENDFVRLVSTGPARVYGLHPRKGSLLPGADADVVLWDPTATTTVAAANRHGALDHTPYEGMTLTGTSMAVYLRGSEAFREGSVLAPPGSGRHLRRQAAAG